MKITGNMDYDACTRGSISKSDTQRNISGSGAVLGVAAVRSELFIVRAGGDRIEVYNLKNFALNRIIAVPGMNYPHSLAACSQQNCLYIGDAVMECVYRVDLLTSDVTQWSVSPGWPRGLSVTKESNLLVTLSISNTLQEFTTRGSLVAEIELDASVDNPRHAVKLWNDRFAVSHAGRTQHRVCVVDTAGRLVHSYGGPPGSSSSGYLNDPQSLVVDSEGNVIVADCLNDRLVLLSSALSHIGDVVTPGHQQYKPYALHLDPLNERMFVGKCTGNAFVSTRPYVSPAVAQPENFVRGGLTII